LNFSIAPLINFLDISSVALSYDIQSGGRQILSKSIPDGDFKLNWIFVLLTRLPILLLDVVERRSIVLFVAKLATDPAPVNKQTHRSMHNTKCSVSYYIVTMKASTFRWNIFLKT
jgi:hypothetical protein